MLLQEMSRSRRAVVPPDDVVHLPAQESTVHGFDPQTVTGPISKQACSSPFEASVIASSHRFVSGPPSSLCNLPGTTRLHDSKPVKVTLHSKTSRHRCSLQCKLLHGRKTSATRTRAPRDMFRANQRVQPSPSNLAVASNSLDCPFAPSPPATFQRISNAASGWSTVAAAGIAPMSNCLESLHEGEGNLSSHGNWSI